MYETTYYPESSIEIEKIVDNVSLINDSYQKLDAIGQWVTYDFIDYVHINIIDYVHINIFEDAKIDYYNLFGYTCYKCDRVRAPPYKYHGDPYWIAYHRFGGCGELAHLYCYVANLSGFETRVVLADYSEGNNHAWVELELNDELMYVDPTSYWCNVHNNTTANEWIMPAKDWNVWDAGLDSIVYEDTKEDVSDHYPLANMTKK